MMMSRKKRGGGRQRTVKVPTAKTVQRTSLRLTDSVDWRKTGIGIRIIIMSVDMLKTVKVMRWFVAAEHWAVEGQGQHHHLTIMLPAFHFPRSVIRNQNQDPPTKKKKEEKDTRQGHSHVLLLGGTAQYWLNGRHQTPR